MDYSYFDVVNFDKYSVILRKTKLDKVVMKKVNKERKVKGKGGQAK
jgi:hypothetical protein